MDIISIAYTSGSLVALLAALWVNPEVSKRLIEAGRSERAVRFVVRIGNLFIGLGGFGLGIVVLSGMSMDDGRLLVFPVGASFLWLAYAVLMPLVGVRGQVRAVSGKLWKDFQRGTLQ